MRLAHKSLSELEWKSLFLISTERNDATQHVIEGMTRGAIYKKMTTDKPFVSFNATLNFPED
jgi:hypothetical protein